MHNRRQEPTRNLCHTVQRHRLSHHISMLAVGLALGISVPALAQDNPVVDLSDPNVSVDLSVLNDGGLAPSLGAPRPAAGGAYPSNASYQAPNARTPVSTLYIKPTSTFTLPPQTKPIEIKPTITKGLETKITEAMPAVPAPAPAVVEAEPAPAPPPTPVEPVEVATVPSPPTVAEPSPPASEPIAETPPEPAPTPVDMPEPEPTPEPEATAALTPPPPAPETPTPPQGTDEAIGTQPETKPIALDVDAPVAPPPPPAATPEPIPTPAPVENVAAASPEAPPPPPQAAAVEPPAEHDETQTAPQPNKVVMPLPPQNQQVASLPPATGPLSDGDSLRIAFEADSSKLPQSARDQLSDMADKMRTQEALRLQLLAYAGNADTSASAARRLSLSRALAVRSFLIENGVRSTRIDVRALGNKSTEEMTERVDITVIER